MGQVQLSWLSLISQQLSSPSTVVSFWAASRDWSNWHCVAIGFLLSLWPVSVGGGGENQASFPTLI